MILLCIKPFQINVPYIFANLFHLFQIMLLDHRTYFYCEVLRLVPPQCKMHFIAKVKYVFTGSSAVQNNLTLPPLSANASRGCSKSRWRYKGLCCFPAFYCVRTVRHHVCLDPANTCSQVFEFSRLSTVQYIATSYWCSNVIASFVATVFDKNS